MRRAITATLFAVLLQGCFTARVPPPPSSSELPTAQQLLESMSDRRRRLNGLRTLARLKYRSPTGNESARHVLAVQRPDRLRIEVVSILGSLLVMTSDRGSFAAYLPREATVYRGTASVENLSPYLPIDITVPAIVDHVLATPELVAGGTAAVDREAGLIRLSQSGRNGSWEARFRDLRTPAGYKEIDRNGRIILEARYEDIDDTGIVPIARKITVRFPNTSESLEISMRDPEINPTFSGTLFSVQPPPETREINLDHAPL